MLLNKRMHFARNGHGGLHGAGAGVTFLPELSALNASPSRDRHSSSLTHPQASMRSSSQANHAMNRSASIVVCMGDAK
jgi:hypothetical protein